MFFRRLFSKSQAKVGKREAKLSLREVAESMPKFAEIGLEWAMINNEAQRFTVFIALMNSYALSVAADLDEEAAKLTFSYITDAIGDDFSVISLVLLKHLDAPGAKALAEAFNIYVQKPPSDLKAALSTAQALLRNAAQGDDRLVKKLTQNVESFQEILKQVSAEHKRIKP